MSALHRVHIHFMFAVRSALSHYETDSYGQWRFDPGSDGSDF